MTNQEKNPKNIAKITEMNLIYPKISIIKGQQGVCVIQFILTPELLIKEIKVIKSSGYEDLDKNSIKIIKKSQKEYPKPNIERKVTVHLSYKLK